MALSSTAAVKVMAIMPGESVRVYERPIHHALSPEALTGIDCAMVGRSGSTTRAVGTVVSRATITGGLVVQGSSFARLRPDPSGRRRSWSDYLARPGVVDTIGDSSADDLAQGFLHTDPPTHSANLGAISARTLDLVQASGLDRRPVVRIARTQVRWTALVSTSGHVHFTIADSTLRTIRLTADEPDLGTVAGFCEDVALHDWLLTCVAQVIDRSRIGASTPQQVASRLRPLVDHVLHLWMPAARSTDALTPLWQGLDQRAGFTRQWEASVGRIRDQIGASSISLISSNDHGGTR
jgi:hypothetical protein